MNHFSHKDVQQRSSSRHVTLRRNRRQTRRGAIMMLVNVVTVMLLILLLVFQLNAGRSVVRKTHLQLIADEAAFAAALWKEHGLNAIAWSQHEEGNGLGLLIAHSGLGGDLLDQRKKAEDHAERKGKLNQLNSQLDTLAPLAKRLGAATPAYKIVRQAKGIFAEATILDAKINLKTFLVLIYQNKIAARLMQRYPPTRPAGQALEIRMHAFERAVRAEYVVLNGFEQAAIATLFPKEKLRDDVLPEIKSYTNNIVAYLPDVLLSTVDELTRRRGGTDLYVSDSRLPVELDPFAQLMQLDQEPTTIYPCYPCRSERTNNNDVTRDQIVKVTQLARATFPWVVYHRDPILKLLKERAPLSKAGKLYKDYSDGYSKQLCDRYQRDEHDLGMYVLRNVDAPDKGFAPWTKDRAVADRVFSTLVAIRMPPDVVIGAPAIFGQHHTHGQIAYAQSLSYNANPQQRPCRKIDLTCRRITPNRQANVGWDTLQWIAEGVGDDGLPKTPWELIAKTDTGSGPTPEFPRWQLNWQAKLVPVSPEQIRRFKHAAHVPPAMHEIVDQLLDDTPGALLTH